MDGRITLRIEVVAGDYPEAVDEGLGEVLSAFLCTVRGEIARSLDTRGPGIVVLSETIIDQAKARMLEDNAIEARHAGHDAQQA